IAAKSLGGRNPRNPGETKRVTRIDINGDMGELPEAVGDGTQEALLRSITSANVACGGHAGDERTMQTTVEQALRARVAVGAHPGYPDRKNFGRLELKMPLDAVRDSLCEQVRALASVAASCGAKLVHVKPHGALYNQAVKNRELAEAIANGVSEAARAESDSLRKDIVLVGLAGSAMLRACLAASTGSRTSARPGGGRQTSPQHRRARHRDRSRRHR